MHRFPDDFLFGCATSAYQVEGGIENDWSSWERAGRLKRRDGFCGRATDHWNRWVEDFDRLVLIGANAYRMSVEWARVEPTCGHYDAAALSGYDAMIDALAARDIKTFVTLLHFTHPPWFHDRCPWHGSRDAALRFRDFAARVARVIGDRVPFWTVINEPGVWLSGAYLAGVIPPGRPSLSALQRAFVNLVAAHAAVYPVLKAAKGDTQIGVAHNVVRFAPSRTQHLGDRLAARYIARQYNHAFPEALARGRAQLGLVPGIRLVDEVPEARGTLDFLGVNYYTRVFVRIDLPWRSRRILEVFHEGRSDHGISDLGWEIYPRGLREALVDMARYGVPLYVTENGLDDRDDSRRSAFLYDHLAEVLEARAAGVDVRGYLHWSLLDNFEWLEGFLPRFGLYRVNYETLERTETKAASVFRRVAREKVLPAERPPMMATVGAGPCPVV